MLDEQRSEVARQITWPTKEIKAAIWKSMPRTVGGKYAPHALRGASDGLVRLFGCLSPRSPEVLAARGVLCLRLFTLRLFQLYRYVLCPARAAA
jgi:hypothetical protein